MKGRARAVTWAGGCEGDEGCYGCVAEGETIVISISSAARCDRAPRGINACCAMSGASSQLPWRCQGQGPAAGRTFSVHPIATRTLVGCPCWRRLAPRARADGIWGLWASHNVRQPITLRALAAIPPWASSIRGEALADGRPFWQFFFCHSASRHCHRPLLYHSVMSTPPPNTAPAPPLSLFLARHTHIRISVLLDDVKP